MYIDGGCCPSSREPGMNMGVSTIGADDRLGRRWVDAGKPIAEEIVVLMTTTVLDVLHVIVSDPDVIAACADEGELLYGNLSQYHGRWILPESGTNSISRTADRVRK